MSIHSHNLLLCPHCRRLLELESEIWDCPTITCPVCGEEFPLEQLTLEELLLDRCRNDHDAPPEQFIPEMECLISCEANVRKQCGRAMPPLFQTCDPRIVQFLLQHGAKPNTGNSCTDTPILNSLKMLSSIFRTDCKKSVTFRPLNLPREEILPLWYKYLDLMVTNGADISRQGANSDNFLHRYLILLLNSDFRELTRRFPLQVHFKNWRRLTSPILAIAKNAAGKTPFMVLLQALSARKLSPEQIIAECNSIEELLGFPINDGAEYEHVQTLEEYTRLLAENPWEMQEIYLQTDNPTLLNNYRDADSYPLLYAIPRRLCNNKCFLEIRTVQDDELLAFVDAGITAKFFGKKYTFMGAKILNITEGYVALLILIKGERKFRKNSAMLRCSDASGESTCCALDGDDYDDEDYDEDFDEDEDYDFDEDFDEDDEEDIEIEIELDDDEEDDEDDLTRHLAAYAVGDAFAPNSGTIKKYLIGRTVTSYTDPLTGIIAGKFSRALDREKNSCNDELFPRKPKRDKPMYDDLYGYSCDAEADDDGYFDHYE